jgi:hypothetical protein
MGAACPNLSRSLRKGWGFWNSISAVSFSSVPDGVNLDRVSALMGEAHAIVADSQTQLAGFTFELLDVAFARLSKALDRSEDAHGRTPVDAADIGTRVLRPVDFLHLYGRVTCASDRPE